MAVPLLASTAVRADTADETRERQYQQSRGDENWAWLREPHESSDFWDFVKYIPLTPTRDDIYLSVGGDVREYVDAFHNELWGSTGHANNAEWLQKYMVHSEVRATRYFRLFIELKSGIESGRLGGPRPVDEDLLDVNQIFLDLDAVPGPTLNDPARVAVRVGRQELSFGSGRLVDVRDGPVNVRSSFDGLRLFSQFSALHVDAFLTRPDLTKPGAFDDRWDSTQLFWGTWATLRTTNLLVDAYYLGLNRQHALFEKGAGHELRHTVGARVGSSVVDPLLYLEIEGAYQFGQFMSGDISAWMLVWLAKVRPPAVPLDPELTLGIGAASGDNNRNGATLRTFNPLFPTGAYFGYIGLNGPPNHIAPRLALKLNPTKALSFRLECWAFWRESLGDGVYSVPGFLLRPGVGNPGRYIGTELEPYVTWNVDHHLSINVTVAYFWVGDFFVLSQPGQNVAFAATWASYRF